MRKYNYPLIRGKNLYNTGEFLKEEYRARTLIVMQITLLIFQSIIS